ncbi:unnamed protein product [Sphagnum jensenii]|uniref:Uncharacterized protein n=1 Tax=Sphagnum jensenii TaxID=128206 RepID=A0ABP1AJZ1_9BRYO
MKRGINCQAPDFDPQGFVDLVAEDVGLIQRMKLQEILSHNGNVEYLQRHGLNGRTDAASFKKCVPVVSYADMQPDILRLVNGETAPILTADPISEFSLSSGTTDGKSKFIPVTGGAREIFFFGKRLVSAMLRKVIKIWRDGKTLDFIVAGQQIETPSGLKAGASSTNYFRSPMFRRRPFDPSNVSCSPDEVVLCGDLNQSMYCHLVCALVQAPEIVKVHATFASTVVSAIRMLQSSLHDICEDIRQGRLNDRITDPGARKAVEKLLKPDPDLASMIERECPKNDWAGVISRIWPNTMYVAGVLSGSMKQYVPILKYFAGDVPLISFGYSASECSIVGLNVQLDCAPEMVVYMIWPETAYYEFIPVADALHDADLTNNKTGDILQLVDLADLELEKKYEIVVTNVSGLYRYRLGDILKVKGFRKTAPIVEIIQRKNVNLSIHSEKIEEEELQAVVKKATQQLAGTSMELEDFSSTVDIVSSPGCYILFWEIITRGDNKPLDVEVLQMCANTIDGGFNEIYQEWRAAGRIGPLELHIVKRGAFNKVVTSAVSKGASALQYKIPRCIKPPSATLEILNAAVVATFKSQLKFSDHAPRGSSLALRS